MNRNITLTITLLFAFIILSSFASAELVINKYTNDFTVSSPNNEQLKLCSCETKVDRIIVENVGNFYADFHVEAQGTYPGSIRIPKADFQLAPKHFQEVLIYIEDSCNLQNTFNYDVVVTNSYGRTQRISRTIRVDVCQNAGFDVTPYEQTVGLCQPAVFNMNISNIGTFADTYHVDFAGFRPNATTDVLLQPGESFTQNVTFQFACNEYGKFTVPMTLTSEKNGPATTLWRTITVTNDYNYSLNLSSRIDVCAQTQTDIGIAVQNLASVPDDLAISTSAPRFVTFPANAHLEPNETKNLTLSVGPTKPGDYRMTITTQDRFGGVQKSRDVDLVVNNCYQPAIEMRSTPEAVVSAPITACCGPKTFYVNLRNDGDRTQTFELSLDGPSFFSLDETSVRLDPGQNANVALRAQLPCTDETYAARVTAWPRGQQQVNVSTQVVINDRTQRTCHMVQIDDDELKVPETATVVPVIVKNTGVEGGTYDITTNSTIFTVQETNITLLPGDQRAIHLVPIVNLTTTEKGRYIVLPTFTLTNQSIPYNEAVGVTLTGKGIIQRFIDWARGLPWSSITLCSIVILLLLLAIIAALILLVRIYAGKPIFADGVRPRALFWWKTLLIAGIVILLVAFFFLRLPDKSVTYERVADTTNATTIEMYQNTELTLNMSQYFTDPDRDILTYTVTQPRDISATVSGTMLTLRPDHNFAGENTLVITASDNKGGVTDSPVFVVRVIPRKNLTFLQWLGIWCHYIVVVGLIILLLIVLLIVLTIPEYRPKPYSGNTLVVVSGRRAVRRTVRRTARRPARRARTTRAARTRRARTTRGARAGARAGARGARTTAIVPARGRQVAVRGAAPARGRQVASRSPVVREFKGSGQTVNIAVGTPQQAAPAVLAVPGYKQTEIVYVGSKEGNTVHTPYCINARRIPKNKRIAFSTKREAVSAGLVPCKMCRPFEGGI